MHSLPLGMHIPPPHIYIGISGNSQWLICGLYCALWFYYDMLDFCLNKCVFNNKHGAHAANCNHKFWCNYNNYECCMLLPGYNVSCNCYEKAKYRKNASNYGNCHQYSVICYFTRLSCTNVLYVALEIEFD